MTITPFIIIGVLALLYGIAGRPADGPTTPTKSNATAAENEIDSNDITKNATQLSPVANETMTTQATTIADTSTTTLPTTTLPARANMALELTTIDNSAELLTSTETPKRQKKKRTEQTGRLEEQEGPVEGDPPAPAPGGSNPAALLAALAGSSSGGMMPGNGTDAEGAGGPLAGILGGLLGALGGASGPMDGQIAAKPKEKETNDSNPSEIRLPRQDDDTSYENPEFGKTDLEPGNNDKRTELASGEDSGERLADSMAAGDGDAGSSSEEEPPGGGDGQGGGLLGALAGLSGGGGDSDLGTLLATVGGLVASLSGDGFDLNALLASGIGLFAGILSDGTTNPGQVVASYIVTGLESITGGGAMNNGAFIGNFLTTLLGGSSAPDEESSEDASQGSDSGSFLGTVVGSVLGSSSG